MIAEAQVGVPAVAPGPTIPPFLITPRFDPAPAAPAKPKARPQRPAALVVPPAKPRPLPPPAPALAPPERAKPFRLPTLEDCQTRDVHYYRTGLRGVKPDCGHQTDYKQCNNCGKVIWTGCVRCREEASLARSLAGFGGSGRVKGKGRGIVLGREKKNQDQR